MEEVIKTDRPKELRVNEERQNIQRTKVMLKNVEVGVEGVIRKDNIVHSKEKKKV